MSSISVRRLDEETLRRLRARADRHGVSMEEEVRRILQSAVSGPERLGDLARTTFGPTHGVELELPRHDPHDPITPE
ncbi:FitA-like ribbon-helix-helix domain-containing protein [Halorhodospira halophila]|uniref:Antitoxin FitA-like ribbon-helix-helix domain-containing protein n=1 Tax=Halorhodospira halophila (strain DSM 244 / SL1) TaxID=349124 RepID=A1WV55_HALHL|nr:hypothetical protein [Halorhodospira halophila]ABM61567.1 conserved hypothetical protein [Halorhodospira halophila SL1]MBK1728813.1 hypothetical protein [Halorhodospira halophila]